MTEWIILFSRCFCLLTQIFSDCNTLHDCSGLKTTEIYYCTVWGLEIAHRSLQAAIKLIPCWRLWRGVRFLPFCGLDRLQFLGFGPFLPSSRPAVLTSDPSSIIHTPLWWQPRAAVCWKDFVMRLNPPGTIQHHLCTFPDPWLTHICRVPATV